MSWIHTMQTGGPMSITAQSGLWGGSAPDKVGPFDNKAGYVTWKPNASTGSYYNNKYTTVQDPQCLDRRIVGTELANAFACTLNAVALTADTKQIIFQNAMPGTRGNYDRNQIMAPGQWNTDAALSKSIRISEGKSFSLRVDATNIFNHAQPTYQASGSIGSRSFTGSNPAMNLGYVLEFVAPIYYGLRPLGYMDSKMGCRTFQARVRFDF